MLHRSHLAPYGYEGNVAGKAEIASQVGQTVVTGAAAALLSGVEGYQGKEYMVGPVPLNLLIGAGLHVAAFAASSEDGEVYGMDADYVHSAAAGAIAVWAANRGFSIGKKMKEKKTAASSGTTPSAATTADVLAGVSAKGLPQGYAGYRPQDVYASQFMR